jgi:hypothetical protein
MPVFLSPIIGMATIIKIDLLAGYYYTWFFAYIHSAVPISPLVNSISLPERIILDL